MEISIINENGHNPVKNAIFTQVLIEGKNLRINNPFTSFEVADWEEFCCICMKAYSDCSMNSRGAKLKERITVRITQPSGNVYHTKIWCNVELNGMHYESLS